jgi:hypothetical protein
LAGNLNIIAHVDFGKSKDHYDGKSMEILKIGIKVDFPIDPTLHFSALIEPSNSIP